MFKTKTVRDKLYRTNHYGKKASETKENFATKSTSCISSSAFKKLNSNKIVSICIILFY